MSGAHLVQRLFDRSAARSGGVRLEVGARPVALDGVAPLRESSIRNSTSGLVAVLGRLKIDAGPGRLDVADVDQSGQRGGPQAGERSAAGIEREMILAVVPARRHHPTILVVEVPFLRLWESCVDSRDGARPPDLPSGSFLTNISLPSQSS